MIQLTNSSGVFLYVRPEDISVIERDVYDNTERNEWYKSRLTIGRGMFFVRETPGDVKDAIEAAKSPTQTKDQSETYIPKWCRRGQGMCIGNASGECGISVADPRTCEEMVKETEEEGKKRGLIR